MFLLSTQQCCHSQLWWQWRSVWSSSLTGKFQNASTQIPCYAMMGSMSFCRCFLDTTFSISSSAKVLKAFQMGREWGARPDYCGAERESIWSALFMVRLTWSLYLRPFPFLLCPPQDIPTTITTAETATMYFMGKHLLPTDRQRCYPISKNEIMKGKMTPSEFRMWESADGIIWSINGIFGAETHVSFLLLALVHPSFLISLNSFSCLIPQHWGELEALL